VTFKPPEEDEFHPATDSRSERRHWCGKYLEGLLREGERKSIEPLAARVGGDEQALQQFVNQSPWDHTAVLHRLRGK
jgi:SRSO17 transposase